MMRCATCNGKATTSAEMWGEKLNVCEKCRRLIAPTAAEKKARDSEADYDGEFENERMAADALNGFTY